MADPKRSKAYGYEVEVAALRSLQLVFPRLTRTGSVAYKKAAADLAQTPLGDYLGIEPLRIVITRDKGQELLVTLPMRTFLHLSIDAPDAPVVVQVKGRQSTWIGRLMRELREATK